MTKVKVIGKIAVTRDHELVIDTCEGVLTARHNMQPLTHNVDIAVLGSTSITICDQLCSGGSHLFDVCKNTLTNLCTLF